MYVERWGEERAIWWKNPCCFSQGSCTRINFVPSLECVDYGVLKEYLTRLNWNTQSNQKLGNRLETGRQVFSLQWCAKLSCTTACPSEPELWPPGTTMAPSSPSAAAVVDSSCPGSMWENLRLNGSVGSATSPPAASPPSPALSVSLCSVWVRAPQKVWPGGLPWSCSSPVTRKLCA